MADLERFAARRDVPVVRFKGREVKERIARPYQLAAAGREGFVLVGKARERQIASAGYEDTNSKRSSASHPHFSFSRQSRVPDQWYFDVRHEAPRDRVGWKGRPPACHSRSDEAEGSPSLGVQARMDGSSGLPMAMLQGESWSPIHDGGRGPDATEPQKCFPTPEKTPSKRLAPPSRRTLSTRNRPSPNDLPQDLPQNRGGGPSG